MTKPETSPELMRAWAVLDSLRPPPAPSTLAHGVEIGLPLLGPHFHAEIRARLVSLVDTTMAEATAALLTGRLGTAFLEGASLTLRFAPVTDWSPAPVIDDATEDKGVSR